MTQREQREVYIRDLSSPPSAQLFFKHGVYTSQPKYYRSARGNGYFAPYFTRSALSRLSPVTLVPIGEGVSYVARIREQQVLPRMDLLRYLKTAKVFDPRSAVALFKADTRKSKGDVLVLCLGAPYLAFPTPVSKQQLRRGGLSRAFPTGNWGSVSATWEDLLAASRYTY